MCANNNLAFHNFKRNTLFESNRVKPKHLIMKKDYENVVKAFKLISESMYPDDEKKPPLEYPLMKQHRGEKVKLRELKEQIQINQFLNDDDSSFISFKSVASKNLGLYDNKYNHLKRDESDEGLLKNKEKIVFKLHTKGTRCQPSVSSARRRVRGEQVYRM